LSISVITTNLMLHCLSSVYFVNQPLRVSGVCSLSLGGILYTVCLLMIGILYTICLLMMGILYTVCLLMIGILYTVCLLMICILYTVCLLMMGVLYTVAPEWWAYCIQHASNDGYTVYSMPPNDKRTIYSMPPNDKPETCRGWLTK